jgi:hypothetical protein
VVTFPHVYLFPLASIVLPHFCPPPLARTASPSLPRLRGCLPELSLRHLRQSFTSGTPRCHCHLLREPLPGLLQLAPILLLMLDSFFERSPWRCESFSSFLRYIITSAYFLLSLYHHQSSLSLCRSNCSMTGPVTCRSGELRDLTKFLWTPICMCLSLSVLSSPPLPSLPIYCMSSRYGQFFGGDSYILLYTYQRNGVEEYVIYFWQVG